MGEAAVLQLSNRRWVHFFAGEGRDKEVGGRRRRVEGESVREGWAQRAGPTELCKEIRCLCLIGLRSWGTGTSVSNIVLCRTSVPSEGQFKSLRRVVAKHRCTMQALASENPARIIFQRKIPQKVPVASTCIAQTKFPDPSLRATEFDTT